jgi:hypothetical protein
MDAAFDRPRRYTRNHNLRLSDVAGQVVETDIADEVVATQRNGADDDPRGPRRSRNSAAAAAPADAASTTRRRDFTQRLIPRQDPCRRSRRSAIRPDVAARADDQWPGGFSAPRQVPPRIPCLMTHRTGAAMSCRDRAHPKAACTLSDGDDLIAIDPVDWPKLLVLLEVFFGVGERGGLPEAAAWLTCNGIGWSWATPAPRLSRPHDRPSVRRGRLGHQDEVSA